MVRTNRRVLLNGALASALAIILCTGCSHLGPKTVAVDRFDSSIAIGESWKQQTLPNIGKVRYMDLPVFMDVASIGGQAIYTDRPNIPYVPMTGDKFLRGLMTPLDPKNIVFLLQSGSAADFILGLAVRIHKGKEKLTGACAAVRYRDYWFWVDNGDLQPKRALTVVMFFFTLAETGSHGRLPRITIPAQ